MRKSPNSSTNWVAATPYLVLLACAALPLFAGSMMGARYRALKRPYAETRMMAGATAAGLIGLTWGAQFSLQVACIGFSSGLAIVLIPAAIAQLIARKPTPQASLEGEFQ